MLHVRNQKAASYTERAQAYTAYAAELRVTARVLRSADARKILLDTAEEYDRMARAITKIDDRRHADLPRDFFHIFD